MVVLGLGVRPEVGLAREAGLEIGSLGGLRVDEHLRTSDPNIWAIGDAIEARDPINLAGMAAQNVLAGVAHENLIDLRFGIDYQKPCEADE